MKLDELRAFSAKRMLLATLVGYLVVAGLHVICLQVYPKHKLDPYWLSDYWPLSVFHWRVPSWHNWGWAIGAVGIYWLLRRSWYRWSLLQLWLGLFALLCAANLTHGVLWGLDYPTAGWGDAGIEYYHDARFIADPLDFVTRFHEYQPLMLDHSRTHPPGPALLYWGLDRLLGSPTLISLSVAALAWALTASALLRLTVTLGVGDDCRRQLLVLIGVLPSTSIYYLAVMDAIFAGLLTWVLAAFVDEKSRWGLPACVLALAAASALSFTFVFVLPVLAGITWLTKRYRRFGWLIAGFVSAWLLVLGLSSFNYARAFSYASWHENQGGFLLFAAPQEYLWYRIGSVLEIAMFFTPAALSLIPLGLRSTRRRTPLAAWIFWLGCGTLGAMLLAGAMRMGEAARLAMFVVPYLLVPVALAASEPGVNRRQVSNLLDMVFGTGLAMQLMGDYQW